MIKVHSLDQQLIDSLLQFNVNPISCRFSFLESDLIVSHEAISWLNKNSIPFSLTHHNVEEMIDNEMMKIKLLKQKRSSNWFSIYRELIEIEEKIDSIVSSSPIVTQQIIGTSYENHDIVGVKISVDNGIENKPSIVISGCQHAREWITPMATTYLIQTLAENYSIDNNLNTFLNGVDIHIIPVMNPDGYVYTWEEDRWWRKNRQPNNSTYCVGTDLNRNWNFDWNGEQSTSEDPCSQIYVGPGPFSAPETYYASEYISSIPNLVGHIDVHSYSSLIVGPWS